MSSRGKGAPRTRPKNLRQRPKKSLKMEEDVASRGHVSETPSLASEVDSDTAQVLASEGFQEVFGGAHSFTQVNDREQVAGGSGVSLQGESSQPAILRELLDGLRSLRDAVAGIERRQQGAEKELKDIKGKVVGREISGGLKLNHFGRDSRSSSRTSIRGSVRPSSGSISSECNETGKRKSKGKGKGKKKSRVRSDSSSPSGRTKPKRRTKKINRDCSSNSSSTTDSSSLDEYDSEEAGRRAAFGSSLPIDASLEQKIKNKIWKGKYVDFRSLLEPEERPTKQRKLQLSISAVDTEVRSVAAQELGPLADFKLWDKAFHVFMAVIMKSPKGSGSTLLDNLLIYRRSIQMMHEAGGDWEAYDIKFRRARAYHPYLVKWHKRQCDLWDDCLRRGKEAGQRKGSSDLVNKGREEVRAGNKSFQGRQANHCYRFQGRESCNNSTCRFSHRCIKCDSPRHGGYKCSRGDKIESGKSGDSKN